MQISVFLPDRPSKIILALLRCSLQSFDEYLKRPDQSVSGQFHQHLNTTSLLPSLSFSPCSRIHVSSAISCSGRGNETTPALLDLFARAAKRAEKRATRETSRAKANRQTKEENERNRNIYIYIYTYRKREGRGMKSFEKCWVK